MDDYVILNIIKVNKIYLQQQVYLIYFYYHA